MVRKEQYEFLKKALYDIELELSDLQYQQLLDYYDLLTEKNKVMNLTAITEYEDVVTKHFVDSLIYSKNIAENKSNVKLIDIGTGAGFPGIPIKIVCPDVTVVLLDSLKKRVLFLEEVIQKLNLSHITAIHGRAEDIARKEEYREEFDYCVSRAVANLAVLTEYCMPFVKVGGYFISYKSGTVETELKEASKAIQLLGGKLYDKKSFLIPNTDINRNLIYIQKVGNTKKRYPRKAGLPAKEPLK